MYPLYDFIERVPLTEIKVKIFNISFKQKSPFIFHLITEINSNKDIFQSIFEFQAKISEFRFQVF